ncbi:hypothetical protein [Streptomyces violascens]|uniref:Uncharacterized protein n=1 Tax=Streptomyces violascens TaxID=67381 RepID=A0ABQ3QSK9_9ACTN|nr:hypothetical protein [Streptomyces violascens]GGU33266.1 hypothetical protein GCM10010289_63150 [Streptomyces violascens]GHI40256.1 hypothetical protein Sviol_46640 [Streptomyces violascens]
MTPRPRQRRGAHIGWAALTVALAFDAVNGCSSPGSSPLPPRTPGAASIPVPGPSASAPAPTIALDEHAAGKVIKVRVGTRVLIRLRSTYWSAPTSSNPQTLAPVGNSGSTPTGTCEPGAGCGIAAADFTARRTGTAQVLAHRNSCGEAMRCGPGQGNYAVTVDII